MDTPRDFDWRVYCVFNRDLWDAGFRTSDQATDHWKSNGFGEQIVTKLSEVRIAQYHEYIATHRDTLDLSNVLECMKSFYDRLQRLPDVPHGFDWQVYCVFNHDLWDAGFRTSGQAVEHWKSNGFGEHRITKLSDAHEPKYRQYVAQFCNGVEEPDRLDCVKSFYDHIAIHVHGDEYWNKSESFCALYNVSYRDIINDNKMAFRYFCYRHISYIRMFESPCVKNPHVALESVLVEYRCFPHVEFLIRNIMLKLGARSSYTVICGNTNYVYMKNMCALISESIQVIRTDRDNLDQSTYSAFLATAEFWNLLGGKKILIYQEDSIIFKSNIEDFLEWDYVGAPWPKDQNDNPHGVGNGGLSLRTRQCMLDVINRCDIRDTEYNSSTLKYMDESNMTVAPEDVYFSLNMIRHNIGRVAPWETAYTFSSETQHNLDSFGGHGIWNSNDEWLVDLRKRALVQFKRCIAPYQLYHRGGWNSILDKMQECDFFADTSECVFFDTIESYFLWNRNHQVHTRWAGIVHCTHHTPLHMDVMNIKNLFTNRHFVTALDKCMFLVALSEHVAVFLKRRLAEIGKNVNVHVLTHPVVQCDKKFTVDRYVENDEKKLVQIGQQMRKLDSLFLLNIPCKKMWLTGDTNIPMCIRRLYADNQHRRSEKLNTPQINTYGVQILYTDTYDQYDAILDRNIVFCDLYDASANNTVLECIERNTPIIINKLPAVIEYLGEGYPLYFEHLDP